MHAFSTCSLTMTVQALVSSHSVNACRVREHAANNEASRSVTFSTNLGQMNCEVE